MAQCPAASMAKGLGPGRGHRSTERLVELMGEA